MASKFLSQLMSQPAQEERKLLGISIEKQRNDLQQMAVNAVVKSEIAKVLAAEAASHGEHGMMAVAHVINNRMNQSGKSAFDVISAPNQFYGFTNKNKDKIYEGVKNDADKIAEKLLRGELGEDFTKGAKFFRQPKEKIQKWHGDETITIKNHIFHK